MFNQPLNSILRCFSLGHSPATLPCSTAWSYPAQSAEPGTYLVELPLPDSGCTDPSAEPPYPATDRNTHTQLGVFCKFTKDRLDPLIQIINIDIKQDWV